MNALLFIIVCLLTLLCFIVFLLRKIKKQKKVVLYLKKWSTWAKKTKKISFWQHIVIVFIGFCLSVFIYLALIKFYHPHFSNPQTTTVNWYTTHNYPMQQDKFYFVTAFILIFLITYLFWFLWILQKNKK